MDKKRRIFRRMLAMLMTMVMVFTMIPEEAFAYGNEDACIANGHGDNWVWVKDGNSHHHKHCYTCGLDFDYDECYVEWTQNDGNTHYGRCKQCHYFTTGPQIHNKDGRTTIVLSAYDVKGNFLKKVSHTNVPCCSVCGYVNPVDAHDYGLVITYDKKPDGGLESSCCVECKTCGDVSPYYNHDTRGHFQIGALHNNYSYHWAVCDICGSTFNYEYHDWVYTTWKDPQSGKEYKEKHCKDWLCGFNPSHHLPDRDQDGHTHEWEYKSAGAGYHRQWCKRCGMPKGPAEKCTGAFTTSDKGHELVCTKCNGKYEELHDLEENGSTKTQCNARCKTCGWTGEWPVYQLSTTYAACSVVSHGQHHFDVAEKHGDVDHRYHIKKCVDCETQVTEDCDYVTPSAYYYLPDTPNLTGRLHQKVCKQCGNRALAENCTRFMYDDIGSTKYHKKTCIDCGQKWEKKGYECHDPQIVENRTTTTTHTFVCVCGYEETKNHSRAKRKENIEWMGGTLYTWDEVQYCKVCGEELARIPRSVGAPDKPAKVKNHGGGKVKVRRGRSRINRSNWGTGAGQLNLDPNLLSAEVVAGGLVDDMAENPGNYLPDDFNLAAQINAHSAELPEGAAAYDREVNDQGEIISESGNTRVVLSPYVEMTVLAFDEDDPTQITYSVAAYYDAYLSCTIGGNTTEVKVIDKQPMSVDYPVELCVPVPADMFLYSKSVVVEHTFENENHENEKYYYLGTRSADDAACTVSFISEQGLPVGGTFCLMPSTHKLVHVDAVAATRHAAGNIEYYACEEAACAKRFKDVLCTQEVTAADCVINQLPETVITVSYDANGGSGDMVSTGTYYMGDTYLLPECTFTPPEGQKFDCWNLGYAGDDFTPMGNVTLKAQWIGADESPTDLRPCTITFDKSVDADEEVSGIMEPQVFQRGIPGQLNPNQYTRPGYVFYGWSRTGSFSDAIVDMATETFYCDTELTAVWRECVTVTYNANGGEGVMEPQAVQKSVYTHLNKNQFTREGYKFIGWNIDPNATTEYVDAIHNRYTDCGYVAQSESKTLYAIWEKQAVVHFDPNCDPESVSGNMADQYVSKSGYRALNKSKYKRDGYTFLGWNKTSTSTYVQTADEGNLYVGSGDEEVTLYAVWGRNNTITFNPNGGSGFMEPQILVTGVSTVIDKCLFTKEGYEFVGWTKYGSTSSTINYQDEENTKLYTDGDFELHAVWKKNITISYDKNAESATGVMDDQVTDNLTNTTLTLNTFARDGYTFMGWSVNPESDKVTYTDGKGLLKFTDDTTLYAVWHKDITVHYEPNAEDATGTMADQTVTDNKNFTLKYNTFTRTGYTFSGWGETPDATYARYKNGYSYTYLSEDTTLYAIWNKDVKLTFNANGGSGTMTAQTMKDKNYTQVKANTYTRDGFEFMGWAPYASSSVAFTRDEGYAYLTENTTWYAVWKPVTTAAVTAAITNSVAAVKDLTPSTMNEEAKENAADEVEKAIDAVLNLEEIDRANISANMIQNREQLEELEENVFKFSSGVLDTDNGAELVYDTTDAPAALAGEVRVTNALLNAYVTGVADEEDTTETGKVAVTFSIGAADANVEHDFGEGYEEDTAVQFSMSLDNVLQFFDEANNAGRLAVPAVVTLPVPSAFRSDESRAALEIAHFDHNGNIKDTIKPVFNDEGDEATFAVSDFSDFAFVIVRNDGKRSVKVTSSPEISAITYGQKLKDTVLTGGVAKAGDTEVEGTFSWEEEDIMPSCSDSNRTAYKLIFTPEDTSKYRTATCSVFVTIQKLQSVMTTAPVAKEGLKYNGSAQELVSAGVATGGTVYYALGNENEATDAYSSAIPQAREEGTYYVWAKVTGDENHMDTAPLLIRVVIEKGADPVKPDPEEPEVEEPQPEEPVTPVVPEPEVLNVVHAINVMTGAVAKNSKGEEISTAKENELISISWLKKDGYEFVKWELAGAVPDSTVSENTAFRMGTQEVTVAFEEKLKVADQANETIPADADTATKVKSLKFTNTKLTLKKHDAAVANAAKAEMAYGTAPEVVYVTENKDVVVVDRSGNFWPTGVGEAVVTAYCGNKKATCKVTVVSYTTDIIIRNEAEEEVNGKTLEMKSGEQAFFNVSFEPYDSTDPRNVTWSSDNKKVMVKNGLVTAKETSEAVTANVTATVNVTDPATGKLKKTITQTVKIHVTPIVVEKAAKADKSHKLTVKKSLKMTANKDKNTAELAISVTAKSTAFSNIKIVSVESSNNDVVSVNNITAITENKKKGSASITLKAQSAGTAYIVVKTSSGNGNTVNVARCKVTVTSPATAITVKSGSLEVKDNKLTMRKGGNGTVEAVLTPEFSTDLGKVKLSGSGGITVKNGIIYAKKISKAGKPAKLTAKCGKLKTTVEVTVTK